MMNLFKKKLDVEVALECAVANIGEYLKSDVDGGSCRDVVEAFLLVERVLEVCGDEHVKGQLEGIVLQYKKLVSGVGLYDGFLITSVSVINYCLLYIRVGKL